MPENEYYPAGQISPIEESRPRPITFCEVMKEQFKDEGNAGELYETARKLLAEDADPMNKKPMSIRDDLSKATTDLADAVLEKIAIDERSHYTLVKILMERLCP